MALPRERRDERGMALALAIVALLVVGLLAAGILFPAIQEARMGENARSLERAFAAAERGAFAILRDWDPRLLNARSTYPIDSLEVTTGGAVVYRLNPELYFIAVSGRDSTHRPHGRATVQRVGLLARIRPPRVAVQAALTTGGAAVGDAVIDGSDHIPAGWTGCGPLDTALAGLRTSPGDTAFADASYADLAARADVTLPGQTFWYRVGPVASNGRCDTTVPTNWGDPTSPRAPCGDYFPIVHLTGDATIGGAEGQGVLLVDGNLSIQGGFRWYGIAVVRGSLVATGAVADVHLGGAALAHQGVAFDALAGGRVTVEYSKCAIVKALERSAPAVMLKSRGWVQSF